MQNKPPMEQNARNFWCGPFQVGSIIDWENPIEHGDWIATKDGDSCDFYHCLTKLLVNTQELQQRLIEHELWCRTKEHNIDCFMHQRMHNWKKNLHRRDFYVGNAMFNSHKLGIVHKGELVKLKLKPESDGWSICNYKIIKNYFEFIQ